MGEGGALCTQRTDVTLEARECHHWATDFWCGGIDRETKNPDGTLIVPGTNGTMVLLKIRLKFD